MGAYTIPKYLEEAFADNFIYTGPDEMQCKFYNQLIGNIHITDGKIIACDPLVDPSYPAFKLMFPIGLFSTELAIAMFDDGDERVGFARIKFSSATPIKWTMATLEGQDLSEISGDSFYGYPVDSGTGGFLNSLGSAELRKFLDPNSGNYMSLIEELNKTYKHTRSWLLWQRDEANALLFSSGLGDGRYPTYIGYDNDNKICRLTTDFLMLE